MEGEILSKLSTATPPPPPPPLVTATTRRLPVTTKTKRLPSPPPSTTSPLSTLPLEIQIASDIHLEFYNEKFPIPEDIIIPSAPVLALLGDIGLPFAPHFEKFLNDQAQKFELVLFIPGNHEFYQHEQVNTGETPYNYSQIVKRMKDICSKNEKLKYFDKEAIHIRGVRVIGATLWTHVPLHAHVNAYAINDYKYIFENDETITPNDTNNWHDLALVHITDQLEQSQINNEKNCVVLTHHAPSMSDTSNPHYEGPYKNKTNHAFGTSLEYLFRDYGTQNNTNIHTWCFGHTHYTTKITKHGTMLMSNQRGYRTERTSYNPTAIIQVPLL